MKNVMQKGIARRRLATVVFITGLLVACGGSSGGGGGVDPVDPPVDHDTTYGVSGAVSGLIAPVTLSNGFESVAVTGDGNFAFEHRYKQGDTFSIAVDTAGAEQLCTLTHGSGLVLGDITDVSVDCLELREANVRIVKPDYYAAFSQLDVRSTYQLQGLTSETASLVVAKNQFITLLTSSAQARPVYLAFIKTFDDIVVDATSTAVAMVLLNPSIHNAIEERAGEFEFFATRFAQLEAVKILADALQTAANKGELDLAAPKTPTLLLLDAAVAAAALDITSADAVAAAKTAARKLNVNPLNGAAVGVDFALARLTTPDEEGNNYQLVVTNNVQRHIAVESVLLAQPVTLAPEANQVRNINSTDISSVLWTVQGPGAQAAAAPVSALLKQAVIDTAIEFYALPSLAFETGRLADFDLRLVGCVGLAQPQQLREQVATQLQADTVFDQALRSPHYTAAYDAVTRPLRGEIVEQLDVLMSCELFRKGRWLDDHIETASSQLATLLRIAEANYPARTAGENVLVSPGLLAAGSVINNSLTNQQWRLSNELDIRVTRVIGAAQTAVAGTVNINEGDAVVLQASCVDPSSQQPVDCTLAWQSVSGNTTGSTFNETYTDSGTFAVTVLAEDADGAATSMSFNIDARELTPNGRLRSGATLITSSYLHNFGDVPVNAVVAAEFTLTNEGDDTLYIDSPQVALPFSVPQVSDMELAPGERANITVQFVPAQALVSSAVISLPLRGDEPQDARTLQFNLRGTGVVSGDTPLINSYWLQRDGDTTNQYNVTSADVIPKADDILEFRAFLNGATDYPHISISLAGFAGEGTYALDDFAGESLGRVSYALSTSQWWSTRTSAPFDVQRTTGTATYTEGNAGQQIVEFEFDVVPWQCVDVPCVTQHVSGRFEVPQN